MDDAVATAALDDLRDAVGGEVLATLVDEFITDGRRLVGALHAAAAARDATAAASASHQLKSTSATFGARALAELCAEVELGARAGAIPTAPLASLDAAFARVETELARYRATLT